MISGGCHCLVVEREFICGWGCCLVVEGMFSGVEEVFSGGRGCLVVDGGGCLVVEEGVA